MAASQWPSTERVHAMILAGGRSQRFGSDKATVVVDGQPLILRLRDQLIAAGHSVSFVADRADRYQLLGIECLVDAQSDSGPLAGLATALHEQRNQGAERNGSPWVLLVSCDQVQWQVHWSQRLLDALASVRPTYPYLQLHPQPQPLAVVFASSMWQPLPGLYHVDLLDSVRERLKQRRLSLHGLLESCNTDARCLSVDVDDPPSGWTFNTRDEFDRLLAHLNHLH